MELEKLNTNSMLIKYQNTDNVLEDVCSIINSAKDYAYQAVNIALVERNWLIGYRIAEEELKGENRADYGTEVLKRLSKEMKEKTKKYDLMHKLEFIKSPVIAEFLGYSLNNTFTETDLETSIINNLQKFLMELGKGYAFVARQQHIHTEKEDYFIDLVFYNYILKCFVLIDLKTKKITHQDVGQMDMYVRMYDELKKSKEDNPTIGILLCSETDADIAKYSILKGNEQLFASKYKLYLPTEEELRAEIESQKTIFNLQHEKGDEN